MDELDHNLLMAWDRVFEKCRKDPVEARRRYERTLPGTTLDRPARAWCVALRASDTRIEQVCMMPDDGVGPGAMGAQAAHEIVLDRVALRRLGGPVWIREPGVAIEQAAAMLGRHKEALRSWLAHRPGRTRSARAESGKGGGYDDNLVWQAYAPTEDRPLGVRYKPQRICGPGRRGGMETPVVWSDIAMDPGSVKGRPPAKWWGTLWQSLAERIPESFEQVVERVPRFVPYPDVDGVKRPRFRGWWWSCPGLLSAGAGELSYAGCGRLVGTLYAPLPVWTVGRYLGIESGLKVAGLSGQWLPGVMDRWAGRRSLACEHCWKLRRTSFTGSCGWNELVSYLSGGLLYGREVQKPAGFEYERRQAYVKRQAGGGAGQSQKVKEGLTPGVSHGVA